MYTDDIILSEIKEDFALFESDINRILDLYICLD